MSVPTFIVSTGRCGSTMLSNMLRDHPHVLSLSEFYGLAVESEPGAECFSSELMDGRRFWALVAAIHPLSNFAYRHGVPSAEQLYPIDAPTARFSLQSGVPGILVTTLPHLTDNPDAVFEVLQDEVIQWPVGTISEHYRHLFGWLARYFNKRLWVERTGSSVRLTEQLLALFPDAKFIHVTRDGRDVAISVQEHLLYRLGFIMTSLGEYLGVDPLRSSDRACIDRVPVELCPFLPEHFDADAFRAFRLPLTVCGQTWTWMIGSGLTVLRDLPDDHLLTLRYEDFFVDPKKQLDVLAAFLGDDCVDDAWSARCAATVRKPKSTWRDLPEDTARALTEACRPGFEQLRAAGVHYDV